MDHCSVKIDLKKKLRLLVGIETQQKNTRDIISLKS